MIGPNLNMLADPVFPVVAVSGRRRWTPMAWLATKDRLRKRGDDPYLWRARVRRLRQFPANAGTTHELQNESYFRKYLWGARVLDRSFIYKLTYCRFYEIKMPTRMTRVGIYFNRVCSLRLVAKLRRQESRGELSWAYYPARRSLCCAGYPFVSILSSAPLRAGLRESFQP